MPRRIHLEPHLTDDELYDRYRRARDPVERGRWHFLWLLASGKTTTAIAGVTGYSAYWIGQIVRRYNRGGPDGVRYRRHRTGAAPPLLAAGPREALRRALAEPSVRATSCDTVLPVAGQWQASGRPVAPRPRPGP